MHTLSLWELLASRLRNQLGDLRHNEEFKKFVETMGGLPSLAEVLHKTVTPYTLMELQHLLAEALPENVPNKKLLCRHLECWDMADAILKASFESFELYLKQSGIDESVIKSILGKKMMVQYLLLHHPEVALEPVFRKLPGVRH